MHSFICMYCTSIDVVKKRNVRYIDRRLGLHMLTGIKMPRAKDLLKLSGSENYHLVFIGC